MAIKQFTKEEFEKALPFNKNEGKSVFKCLGTINNEICYAWYIGDINKGRGKFRILLRSSIPGNSDKCATTGEDSIRIIIERLWKQKWVAIGKGSDAYTTRRSGWELRLKKKIKEVFYLIKSAKQDFTDDERVFIVKKKGPHKGKIFAKSIGNDNIRWLS